MTRSLALALVLLVCVPALGQDEPKGQEDEQKTQEKEEARLLKKARRLAEDDEKEAAYKAFLELANTASSRKHLDVAATALEEARAVAPDEASEAQLLTGLGRIYMEQGEHARSVKAFRREVKLSPKDAHGWNSLGMELHLLGDEEESVEAFEKCVELDSGNKEARYSLGVAARLTGRPLKALKAHEKLLEAAKRGELTVSWYFPFESKKAQAKSKGIQLESPGSREAVCQLEVACDHAFADELDEARTEIEALASGDKDELAPALAVVIDEMERALELRPHELQLHYLLGLLHEAKGEKEEAKAELEAFVAREKELRAAAKKAREKLEAKD
jgi:tetratricopeptide (TPR) repeat protein